MKEIRNFREISDIIKKNKKLRFYKDVESLLGLKEIGVLRKRNTIPLENLVTFCNKENWSLDWLLTGEGPQFRGGVRTDELPQPYCTFVNNLSEIPTGIRSEDFLLVPIVGTVAAGEPVISEDKIEGWAIINISQVGRKTNLVVIRVGDEKDDKTGRSMEPIIRPSSMVAIDRNERGLPKDRKLTKKRIYAVRKDGGCTLKFVQHAGDRLILIPANREVADIEEVDLRTAVDPIVGRAIWSWQTL